MWLKKIPYRSSEEISKLCSSYEQLTEYLWRWHRKKHKLIECNAEGKHILIHDDDESTLK